MKTAVVTGIGSLSPQGQGIKTLQPLIQAGILDSDMSPRIETQLIPEAQSFHEFKTLPCKAELELPWLPTRKLKRLNRVTRLALKATQDAIIDANYQLDDFIHQNSKRPWGISYGSALAGFSNAESVHETFLKEGKSSIEPSFAFQLLGATLPGQIGLNFGLNGPILANSNSCAAGNTSIGEALKMIQLNEANVVIAGAAECATAPLTLSALDRLGVISKTHPMRPYHPDRDGFIPAEAACSLIIEEEQHARQRGARIYARISSYAYLTESHDMTTPQRDGTPLKKVIEQALHKAKLHPTDIDFASHHASGTQINDANEGAVMRDLFPKTTHHALKSYTGHSLGAASALEAALCCLAIHREGYRSALSNAFGFGGIDTALIFQNI